MSGFNPYDKTHCEIFGWVITAVITICYVYFLRVIWYNDPITVTDDKRVTKRHIKEDELPPEIKKKLGL